MSSFPNPDTQFSASRQPKGNGRKPSKLRKFLKVNNLSALDIQLIASNLINATLEELEEMAEDRTKPILLCGAARAFLRDYKEGTTPTMQWLIDRAFGKSKEALEFSGSLNIRQTTDEELNQQLQELVKIYVENHIKKE